MATATIIGQQRHHSHTAQPLVIQLDADLTEAAKHRIDVEAIIDAHMGSFADPNTGEVHRVKVDEKRLAWMHAAAGQVRTAKQLVDALDMVQLIARRSWGINDGPLPESEKATDDSKMLGKSARWRSDGPSRSKSTLQLRQSELSRHRVRLHLAATSRDVTALIATPPAQTAAWISGSSAAIFWTRSKVLLSMPISPWWRASSVVRNRRLASRAVALQRRNKSDRAEYRRDTFAAQTSACLGGQPMSSFNNIRRKRCRPLSICYSTR